MLSTDQQQKYLDDLFNLLRIPSISTLPEHKQDVLNAALWIAEYAENVGFDPGRIEMLYAKELDEQKHHPVVFAERIDNPDNPTVMIYGHYDVQPVDPIDQWKSEPFEPELRDGNIYARGATDDKGQMFTYLAALDYLSQEWGEEWPINVKLLIEGEEEHGGENVESLIEEFKNSSKFSADLCLISDGPWVTKEDPTIGYGLRGITYMQINVRLAAADLHSGLFGGGVLNPANALTQILAKLQDPQTGKVLIPGFYDSVAEITEEEKAKIAEVPYDEAQLLQDAANSKATWGESGYSVPERLTARPTLDINGMWSGFTGEGAKTIIPATAHAKVSMRLVADQDPWQIAELFEKYVTKIAPKEVDVSVTTIHGGDAMLTSLDSEYVKIAAEAVESAFGRNPVFTRSGGSIPAVAMIQNLLGVTPVMIEYGQPDDALHSPNEKLSKDNFLTGIECNIELFKKLGK